MSNHKTIFVSYRHTQPDSELAHYLAETLTDHGHKVFIDSGIRWGRSWVEEIEQALKECDFLLLLLSKDAAASEMVIEEVAIAKELARQQNGRPTILPLRVNFPFSYPLPYNLSAYLRSIQQESWAGENDTPRIKRLLVEIASSRVEASEWKVDTPAPRPPISDPTAAPSGGALSIDSPYYVTRDADEDVMNALRRTRQVVSIRGARQTGKTSLLVRLRESFRQRDTEEKRHACALVDLQLVEGSNLDSLANVWRAVTDEIALDLGIYDWLEADDRSRENYRQLLNQFLDRYIFNEDFGRLVILLDEADRLFEYQIRESFFGSVRGLFNKGATDSIFSKVAWVLASSTEPQFFIEDPYQSPFNIGHRFDLGSFSSEQTVELAVAYGFEPEDELISKVLEFAGGRPFITNNCFFLLKNGEAEADVLRPETFASHLHRYLLRLQVSPNLAKAMKDIVRGRGVADNQKELTGKLLATGLVKADSDGYFVPASNLYREFFSRELES